MSVYVTCVLCLLCAFCEYFVCCAYLCVVCVLRECPELSIYFTGCLVNIHQIRKGHNSCSHEAHCINSQVGLSIS